MSLSFSVSEVEYESLRSLILVAYENLHNDLEEPKLSEHAICTLSRELSTLARLKKSITNEEKHYD
jgi:hypothetical protein